MTERGSEWAAAVLGYDPFSGDKDDGGYRLLSDRIVTARTPRRCATCFGDVAPGTRVRVMRAVEDERTIRSTTDCQDCCDAMAVADEDFGEAAMSRYDLGRRRAEAGRRPEPGGEPKP